MFQQRQARTDPRFRNDPRFQDGPWRYTPALHYADCPPWQIPQTRHPLYIHRRKLPPVIWGLLVLLAARILHVFHPGAIVVLLVALVLGGVLFGGTRWLKSQMAQNWSVFASVATGMLLPALAFFPVPPVLGAFFASWAALTGWWLYSYGRIRNTLKPAPKAPTGDAARWARLAEHRKWNVKLGAPEKIPNGVTYPLRCDGIETHIGDVIADPKRIAAAWHKPVTEAYVERDPGGVESMGSLTILRRGTLQEVRPWDGSGYDAAGIGVIGRYADGSDAHIQLFAPDGTRHGLVAGTTGSGKTQLLDLLILKDLKSGILPIVLDPQNGQSLPHWRGRVPYASGVSECMQMLTLVHGAMMERSDRLAWLEWEDHGHKTIGMPHFDAAITGWPVVHLIADELPMLLTSREYGRTAVHLTGEIAKLGRKTGVSLWPVAQVPSLGELQDQVIRSMLVGGSVVCFRTGDRVSAGMLGLPADPRDLPGNFPNGETTGGLGYIIGPDNRQAVARTDFVPAELKYRHDEALPMLDPAFADAVAAFGRHPTLTASLGSAPAIRTETARTEPEPAGRTCADAILAVLDGPMPRGEIHNRIAAKATEWGRSKSWDIKSVSDALARLKLEGRITQAGDRAPYEPMREGVQQ